MNVVDPIINIFTMMFVYHYLIIPFQPQYLPRHAPQGAGIQGAGIGGAELSNFLYCIPLPLDAPGTRKTRQWAFKCHPRKNETFRFRRGKKKIIWLWSMRAQLLPCARHIFCCLTVPLFPFSNHEVSHCIWWKDMLSCSYYNFCLVW